MEKTEEKVIVHVRIRPFNEEDRAYSKDSCIEETVPDKGLLVIKKDFDKKTYLFDGVLSPKTSQEEVFDTVALPVVNSVLSGYNGTILAYGQTGTGKTHTMVGGPSKTKGIIPRSLSYIFDRISQDTSSSYTVQIAFLQLYMEMLQDLLLPDNKNPIKIRESTEEGVYLSGIKWVPATSVRESLELLKMGDRNRTTAFTRMNVASSRSHAVYMIKIEKRPRYSIDRLEELEQAGEVPDQSMTKSTLFLVDLAGSERVKKSKASGFRLDEAKTINLALLALGNVIHSLSDKNSKFVPFRDSKLTRLLEDSLGGNSKTALLITIGPSTAHLQETVSSLQFGSRAMKVQNKPKLNKIIDYKALCAQLQAELDRIKDGDHEWLLEKQQLLDRIIKLEEKVSLLRTEKENAYLKIEELNKLLMGVENSDGNIVQNMQDFVGQNAKDGKPDSDSDKEEEIDPGLRKDISRRKSIKKIENIEHFEDEKSRENLEKTHKTNDLETDLQEKLTEYQKLIEETDSVVASQEQEISELKNQLLNLQTHHAHLQETAKHHKEALDSERQDREQYAAQLNNELYKLKDKLHEEKQKSLQKQKELEVLNAEKTKNLQQIQEISEEFNYTRAQHTDEIHLLDTEIQRLKHSLEINNHKYNDTVLSLENKLEETQQEIAANKEIESLKCENYEKEISSLNIALHELRNEHISKEKAAEDVENRKMTEILEMKDRNLSQTKDTLAYTEKELKQAKRELDSSSLKLKEKDQEILIAKEDNRILLKDMHESSNLNKKLLEKLHDLEGKLQEIRDNDEKNTKQLEITRTECEKLGHLNSQLETQNRKIQEREKELNLDIKTFSEQIKSKDKFIDEYKSQLRNKTNESSHLQTQLDLLVSQINTNTQDINSQFSHLIFSELPSESSFRDKLETMKSQYDRATQNIANSYESAKGIKRQEQDLLLSNIKRSSETDIQMAKENTKNTLREYDESFNKDQEKISQEIDEEINKLTENYELSVDQFRNDYYEILKSLKKNHENQVQEMKKKESSLATEARNKHSQALEALKETHSQRMNQIEQQYQSNLMNEDAHAEYERNSKTEIEKHQKEVKKLKEILSKELEKAKLLNDDKKAQSELEDSMKEEQIVYQQKLQELTETHEDTLAQYRLKKVRSQQELQVKYTDDIDIIRTNLQSEITEIKEMTDKEIEHSNKQSFDHNNLLKKQFNVDLREAKQLYEGNLRRIREELIHEDSESESKTQKLMIIDALINDLNSNQPKEETDAFQDACDKLNNLAKRINQQVTHKSLNNFSHSKENQFAEQLKTIELEQNDVVSDFKRKIAQKDKEIEEMSNKFAIETENIIGKAKKQEIHQNEIIQDLKRQIENNEVAIKQQGDMNLETEEIQNSENKETSQLVLENILNLLEIEELTHKLSQKDEIIEQFAGKNEDELSNKQKARTLETIAEISFQNNIEIEPSLIKNPKSLEEDKSEEEISKTVQVTEEIPDENRQFKQLSKDKRAISFKLPDQIIYQSAGHIQEVFRELSEKEETIQQLSKEQEVTNRELKSLMDSIVYSTIDSMISSIEINEKVFINDEFVLAEWFDHFLSNYTKSETGHSLIIALCKTYRKVQQLQSKANILEISDQFYRKYVKSADHYCSDRMLIDIEANSRFNITMRNESDEPEISELLDHMIFVLEYQKEISLDIESSLWEISENLLQGRKKKYYSELSTLKSMQLVQINNNPHPQLSVGNFKPLCLDLSSLAVILASINTTQLNSL